MTSAHFGFTKLVVGDLERSADFYKAVCGLVEQVRVQDSLAGRATSEILFQPTAAGGPTFTLFSFPDTPAPASSEVILGFMTPDIAAFVARVRAAGGSVLHDIETRADHGVKVALVLDIEGHMIEVVEFF